MNYRDQFVTQYITYKYSSKLRGKETTEVQKSEEITKGTVTHKHTETVSRYFDWNGRLSQSKESKCL